MGVAEICKSCVHRPICKNSNVAYEVDSHIKHLLTSDTTSMNKNYDLVNKMSNAGISVQVKCVYYVMEQ